MNKLTNIVSLSERRAAQMATQSEPPVVELTKAELHTKYVEERKNLLDFLTTTLVVCNKQPELTEAVVFLRDPDTGAFMPGATSQKVMDDLLKTLGVDITIQAMPDGEHE